MSDSFHEDATPIDSLQPTYESPGRLDFLTLLGHPHDQASPQLTEPFWQQGPEIAYPQTYYYPEQDFFTLFPIYYAYPFSMDPTPVVIGFKSRYARTNAVESNNSKMKRPRQMVQVYLQNDYVGEISLGVLVRFSKLAKASFPRPQTTPEQTLESNKSAKPKKDNSLQAGLEVKQGDSKSWADLAEAEHVKDVDHAEHAAGHDHEDAVAPPAATPTTSEEPRGLSISVAGAWIQPEVSVAKHILNWMQQNKRTHNNEPLLPLTPQPLSSIPLKALIDTYTGVLAYDLVPFPHELRHEIMTRLTKEPTQGSQIRYLYERLPVEDPILNRMVTSYFEHLEADHYTQAEIDDIHEYVEENVGDEGELHRHFSRVKRNRNKKQLRECAMKKLREGFEHFAGPMMNALPAEEGIGNGAIGQGVQNEGRRRNRRQQQVNGKAKGNGKANASASKGKTSK